MSFISSYFDFMALPPVCPVACCTKTYPYTVFQSQKELSKTNQNLEALCCSAVHQTKHSLQNTSCAKTECFGIFCMFWFFGGICGLLCFGGGFFVVQAYQNFKSIFAFRAYIILYFETWRKTKCSS